MGKNGCMNHICVHLCLFVVQAFVHEPRMDANRHESFVISMLLASFAHYEIGFNIRSCRR